MRRPARTGNDDFYPPLLERGRVALRPIRRPVGAGDRYLTRDPKIIQNLEGILNNRVIGIAAEDEGHLGIHLRVSPLE